MLSAMRFAIVARMRENGSFFPVRGAGLARRALRRRPRWRRARLSAEVCRGRGRGNYGLTDLGFLRRKRREADSFFAQHRDDCTDRGSLSLLDAGLGQHPGVNRLHFHVGFIGLNLGNDVAYLDLVPDLLQPPEDLSLLHGVTQTGHKYLNGHALPPLTGEYICVGGAVETPLNRTSSGLRRCQFVVATLVASPTTRAT